MPTIEKSVTIPSFTEVEVEIDTDEVLEEMENSDILDYLVEQDGFKSIVRSMQSDGGIKKEEFFEAMGSEFFKVENTLPDIETIIQYVHTSMGSANKLKLMKNILSSMEG